MHFPFFRLALSLSLSLVSSCVCLILDFPCSPSHSPAPHRSHHTSSPSNLPSFLLAFFFFSLFLLSILISRRERTTTTRRNSRLSFHGSHSREHIESSQYMHVATTMLIPRVRRELRTLFLLCCQTHPLQATPPIHSTASSSSSIRHTHTLLSSTLFLRVHTEIEKKELQTSRRGKKIRKKILQCGVACGVLSREKERLRLVCIYYIFLCKSRKK